MVKDYSIGEFVEYIPSEKEKKKYNLSQRKFSIGITIFQVKSSGWILKF